jgi:hypothetical protein
LSYPLQRPTIKPLGTQVLCGLAVQPVLLMVAVGVHCAKPPPLITHADTSVFHHHQHATPTKKPGQQQAS